MLLLPTLFFLSHFSGNQGEPLKSDKNEENNSQKIIHEWMSRVQQSVLPLPPNLIQNLTKRSGELSLPVLTDPGKCRTHSKHALKRVLESDTWALSMLDSSSFLRMGPGLLDGRLQDMGNFDQCVRVREPGGQFVGQNCIVEMRGLMPQELSLYFGQATMNNSIPGGYMYFTLCVPSSCSCDDVFTHVDRTLRAVNITEDYHIDVYCPRDMRPPQLRFKDWCAVTVFTTIGVLVLLSTCYEYYSSKKRSELLLSFSIISNWQELTESRKRSDISCLDGLRILSSLAIVVGHRFFMQQFTTIFNFKSYMDHRKSLLFAILGSGGLAVEAFFVMSGAMRAYNFLQAKHKGKSVNLVHQGILRYFRITPVLAVMVLFTSTLAIHVSNGPMWTNCVYLDETICNHLWFLNILHLSNWLLPICRPQSWYLASDYQLFLLSPLLLVPLYRRPRLGLLLLAACFSLSTLPKMASAYIKVLFPDLIPLHGPIQHRNFSLDNFNTFYKAGTFIMGIFLGYILYLARCSGRTISLSKWVVWLGWSLSIVVLVLTPPLHSVYLQPDYKEDPWMSLLYVGLWERVFAAVICWIVLACTLGYGGWVNSVLSWPVLRPLAKLTFSVYMVHLSVQTLHVFRSRQTTNYDTINIAYLGISDAVISWVLGTILYLTVEVPCYRVASYFLSNRSREHPEVVSQKSQLKSKTKRK